MLDQDKPKDRLIAAAMKLAAERAWSGIALLDIAEAAGMSLVDLKAHFASKAEIVRAFTAAVDDEVLRKAPRRQPGQATRDAIFEVVMGRFDALEPYKAAVRSIVAGGVPDPAMARAMLSSQHWMLQAAGVETSGSQGAVRTLGLATVYASVFRTWLDDDDPGLARTMAALDRRLRRGEQNLKALDSLCGLSRRMAEMLRPRPRASRPEQPAPSTGADPSAGPATT